MNMVYKAALIIKLMDKKGGQFLKKLWCCVGGVVKQNFGFINQVDKVNCLPLRDWKLTFLALALRQSESLKLWVAISLYREWWSYALGRNMATCKTRIN